MRNRRYSRYSVQQNISSRFRHGVGDLPAQLARDDRPALLAQRVPVPDGARQRHRFRLPGGAVGEDERRSLFIDH